MDNLSPVDKNETFKILTRVSEKTVEVHFMEQGSQKISKCKLFKNPARRLFYLDHPTLNFPHDRQQLTFKIIFDQKLYFLKTFVKKGLHQYYFDNLNDMFELVRRKKPRYLIPESWAQSAKIQSENVPLGLKSPADIIDMSKSGMRVHLGADIPRYQKNDEVLLSFKIYRRGEITVKSKIIHLQNSPDGTSPPLLGLKFLDNSILMSNKIQNVCDDLAFFWTNAANNYKQI